MRTIAIIAIAVIAFVMMPHLGIDLADTFESVRNTPTLTEAIESKVGEVVPDLINLDFDLDNPPTEKDFPFSH